MNKIAILIINWNDYNNTKECLDTLIKNNPKNDYSIIIIDNNSKDGSREKLISEYKLTEFIPNNWTCEKSDIFVKDEGFSNYTGGNLCLKLNDNYGFTGANNFGMKFAYQHNFQNIMWLNNDTIVPSDLITQMEIGLEKYPNSIISPAIVFYPDTKYLWFFGCKFSWYGKSVCINYKKNIDNIKADKYIESIFCSGCLMFYSRNTLKKLGGQDNQYFFNLDDADYSYDAHLKGITTIVDTKTILYHKSARSVQGKPGLSMYYGLRNLILFRKKFFNFYQNIPTYIYTIIHCLGVVIIFGLKGYKPYRFVKILIQDILSNKTGKFTGNITD